MDDQRQLTFFVTNNELEIKFLKDVISPVNLEENLKDASDVLFAFSDPSEYESPGWCLRNYIFMLLKLCPSLIGKTIRVLSVRSSNLGQLNSSLVFELDLAGIQTEKLDKTQIRWIGWEANEQGKMGPKLAAMADSMDPVKLSEHFSNLNLKLMKWRLLPELNLNVLKVQKCLLFGAGTLGCSVARNLIAWGVNHITFIDCGNVSYSNPVRQSLFTHEDAAKNLRKATTAAKRLKEVLPSVKSEGYVLQIPMPDHAVGAQMMEKTLDEIETIKKLVESHDVLFLLTDSRESRWLPTLLGSYYKKVNFLN